MPMKSTNGSERSPAEIGVFCNGMLSVLKVKHVLKCCVQSVFFIRIWTYELD